MKKTAAKLVLMLSAVLICLSPVFAADSGRSGKTPGDFTNVILIGWDGTDRDTLMRFLQAGKLPNLDMIRRSGTMIKTEISTGKTETKPGWAEILTGYSEKITGVRDNRSKYRPIPKGYTVFERLKTAFKDNGIVTVFLAGKRPNLGARGPHRIWIGGPRKSWDLEELWSKQELLPAPETIFSFPGEPYFLTKDSLDVYQNGLNNGENVIKRVLECLNQYKKSRFFLFAHFEEPDEQGHVYGGYSDDYSRALLNDDRWLGMIISALKKHGLYEKTLIYVVSDHGFDPAGTNHHYEPHTFLATNDSRVKRATGDRKDITPTILSRYGLDLTKIKPALEGVPLNE